MAVKANRLSRAIRTFDRRLAGLGRGLTLALATAVVGAIATADLVTGYEVSMSLFYLAPVGLAAWYSGRGPGIAVAMLSCVAWFGADQAAGHDYSHVAIPFWNALVRLGIFLIAGLLLTQLHQALRRERRLARIDGLTGLLVRRAFEERLEHGLALARRQQTPITLAYIDLDGFKRVNDTYGHTAGDRVLIVAGEALAASTRSADTVARLGGDEFALILPDTSESGAQQVVSNLTQALERAFAAIQREFTCSVGVVTFEQAPATAAAAVAAADRLMYEVKRQGKGAVAYRREGAGSLVLGQ